MRTLPNSLKLSLYWSSHEILSFHKPCSITFNQIVKGDKIPKGLKILAIADNNSRFVVTDLKVEILSFNISLEELRSNPRSFTHLSSTSASNSRDFYSLGRSETILMPLHAHFLIVKPPIPIT
ncbi:hypothetical protein AVEN_56747-1 [Araneus ventricosus]|uniref:Uncharacterized protein n=1 Tax=Araneus ventricosus TaxID=182803 RepID=A0A4Y2IT34_ARAVE|nr:hypothetical protein AVEN_56747-1 [Araneus ventricosus]